MAFKVNGKKRVLPEREAPSLANEGDPLVNSNGLVLPEKRIAEKEPISSNTVRVSEYKPLHRRSIDDLPASPNAMNFVFVVLNYTLCGITDLQIADATGTKIEDVHRAKESDAYNECFQMMMDEIINVNSEFIEGRIASYSRGAAETVGHLSKNAKKEATKLSASKDILDRAGLRPQDNVMKQSGLDELRIVITSEGSSEVELNFGKKG